jgi:putative transposase
MAALVATAQQAAEDVPVTRGCQALALSRATYYRGQRARPAPDQAVALRAQLQAIALELPSYGYRRLTYALPRRGLMVNHQRVRRLLCDDNVRCRRQRGFGRITDAVHAGAVYPKLRPAWMVDGLDQWCGADMTDIRLPQAFVSLAVLRDAYRRWCIGWTLDRSLEAERALAARRMALATRVIRPGLVHHSDCGVPSATHASTNLRKAPGSRISMRRTGNPYDKAQAASFSKTLPYEDVHMGESQNVAEAHGRIGHFLAEVDNA